ncbi:MAG TPA: patatin-like phospholipase family protein [Acidobacteriaceae bacterium]|nr:patatin-like phospholipase family protein [Acidobacteriaceae bacterium]
MMKLRRQPAGLAASILALALSIGVADATLHAQAVPGRPETTLPEAGPDAADARANTASGRETKGGTPIRIEGMPPGGSSLPAAVPAGRPAIALVLEGGGALGLAHIGVLKWFEENHIPVDRIAGTSMGALVGALYASGDSPQQIQNLAQESEFTKVFTFEVPYTDLSFRRRQDRRDLPQGIHLGLKGGLSFRNALLTDRGLAAFLQENFPGYNSTGLDFNRMPIPFRCVAADLTDSQAVVFAGGPIDTAVRASIAIPGIFPPLAYHAHALVDGSIVDNLPTDIAKDELDAQIVIAVHLKSAPFTSSDVNSIIGVFTRAYSVGTSRNVSQSEKSATVLISAATEKFSVTDYGKANQLVDAGYAAAEASRNELLKYRLNDADWAAYLAAREARRAPHPGRFEMLRIEGGSPAAQAAVRHDLAPLKKQPIDQEKVFDALSQVEASGSYEAGFATFPQQAASVDNTSAAPDTGVLVHLVPVRNGPPFLIVGADISAENSNVTRGTADFRLVDQDLGGFGSEFRGDLRLGFLTQADGEYYRLLSHKGFFLQPRVDLLREPMYLWTNQVRSSEWFEQEAGGGIDVGRTFSRNAQFTAEWQEEIVRWHQVLGPDSQPDLSGGAQTARLHWVYDNRASETVSPGGIYLDLSAGALFHALASQNAPLVQLALAKTGTLGQKNILAVAAEGNSYLRRNVAQPLRFTLGGPLHLSASSVDEYRGTDDYFARGEYLRQLASLPSGLGQGLYLMAGYEAGEVWSPENAAFLREDGSAGLVAATPVGVITFGGSVGDAGRRKIFFTLGRYF